MKRFLALLTLTSSAYATPIFLNDLPLEPPLETRADLDSTSQLDERLPLALLERFGVVIQTSSLDGTIRMQTEPEATKISLKLEWQPEKGWVNAAGEALAGWNAPTIQDGTTYVPIKCLQALGFSLEVLETGIQVRQETKTLPSGGLNQILELRSLKGRSSRITLALVRTAEFFVLEKPPPNLSSNCSTQSRCRAFRRSVQKASLEFGSCGLATIQF